MKTMLIEKIAGEGPLASLADSRVAKYLWVEILINPQAPEILAGVMKDEDVQRALSWHAAYRSLFANSGKENFRLESLCREKGIMPFKIKLGEHRAHIKEFLKGLQCLKII